MGFDGTNGGLIWFNGILMEYLCNPSFIDS